MKQVPAETQEKIKELNATLAEKVSNVESTLGLLNGAINEANVVIDELNKIREDVHDDIEEYMSEQPESWDAEAAGYTDWSEEWDTELALMTSVEVETPDELDASMEPTAS